MNKQRIIIVEGIDMVGKTSIVNSLSNKLNINSYKEVREEKWYDHRIDLMYAEEARIQMLEQIGFDIIFDRSYPSEYAYAHAYNRETIDDKIYELDSRYALLGTRIIYLFKTPESFQHDKTGLIDFDKYSKIHAEYEKFLHNTKCANISIDTTDQNLSKQIETIINFLQETTWQ